MVWPYGLLLALPLIGTGPFWKMLPGFWLAAPVVTGVGTCGFWFRLPTWLPIGPPWCGNTCADIGEAWMNWENGDAAAGIEVAARPDRPSAMATRADFWVIVG